MLPYMDYVQQAFYKATNWNEDNSYANLTATARALLDFHTPRGLSLHLSSLSSPNFATSYTLSNLGVVDGSISYLYSSLALNNVHKSQDVDLHDVVQSYRQLRHLIAPEKKWHWEVWQGGVRIDRRDSLLYGRMYLPTSTLEMLYLRRRSPRSQLRISAVSDAKLKNGGTILAMLQQDVGKWSTEYLYSTSEGLIGARGLYNFGDDPRKASEPPVDTPLVPAPGDLGEVNGNGSAVTPLSSPPSSQAQQSQSDSLPPISPATTNGNGNGHSTDNGNGTTDTSTDSPKPPQGRFSLGAELYYGVLNKSGGLSTGLRYTTLPPHPGPPVTMTLTICPLMGHLSTTYAIKAGPDMSFCSRFDFNIYSYESDVVVGCELWKRRSAHGTWPSASSSSATTASSSFNTGPTSALSPWSEHIPFEQSPFAAPSPLELPDAPEPINPPTISITAQHNPSDAFTGVLKARWTLSTGLGVLWEGRVKHLLFSLGANIDFRRREGVVKGVGVEVQYSS
ncbi:hypothetical protein BDZ91DRAFT_727957, partial [Kalaharituber pfeilii]